MKPINDGRYADILYGAKFVKLCADELNLSISDAENFVGGMEAVLKRCFTKHDGIRLFNLFTIRRKVVVAAKNRNFFSKGQRIQRSRVKLIISTSPAMDKALNPPKKPKKIKL